MAETPCTMSPVYLHVQGYESGSATAWISFGAVGSPKPNETSRSTGHIKCPLADDIDAAPVTVLPVVPFLGGFLPAALFTFPSALPKATSADMKRWRCIGIGISDLIVDACTTDRG